MSEERLKKNLMKDYIISIILWILLTVCTDGILILENTAIRLIIAVNIFLLICMIEVALYVHNCEIEEFLKENKNGER